MRVPHLGGIRFRVETLTVALLAFPAITDTASAQNSVTADAECTLVIGFSQTADWYLAPQFRNADPDQPEAGAIFESIVDDDRWQLMWSNGAGVNVYSNPDSPAWSAPIVSPCAINADAPTRIVYMISGPFGEDVPGWVAEIETAVGNMRNRFPGVRAIALQPVVGAPADAPGDECFMPNGGRRVRASWQATPIIAAIEVVAREHSDVIVGATTRLRSCSHYVDSLGHISDGESFSGAADAAVRTGLFYRDFAFRTD